jgi:hypothetical protein
VVSDQISLKKPDDPFPPYTIICVVTGSKTVVWLSRGAGGPPEGASWVHVCPLGATIVKVAASEFAMPGQATTILTVPTDEIREAGMLAVR